MAQVLFKNKKIEEQWSKFIDCYNPKQSEITINNIVYDYTKKNRLLAFDEVSLTYIDQIYRDTINKRLNSFLLSLEEEVYIENN